MTGPFISAVTGPLISTVPLEIVGSAGTPIGTVMLNLPLRLGLQDAMELMAKLAGDTAPAAAPTVSGDGGAEALAAARAEHEETQRLLAVRNLRDRAAALDLPTLHGWLRTLDPANPHMAVAFDVVSDEIARRENGAAPEPEPEPEPESIRADVQPLVDEARRLAAQLTVEQQAAQAGDEAARVRANDVRSRLVQLQADIADGIDRRGEEEQ